MESARPGQSDSVGILVLALRLSSPECPTSQLKAVCLHGNVKDVSAETIATFFILETFQLKAILSKTK